MLTKKILPFLLFFGTILLGHAQDLIRKVPADANFLISVNNKAVFKHLDINDVNQTFTRLGLFQKVFQKEGLDVSRLQDLGIDFSSKAYFFGETTDSVQYIGGLIPLSDANLFDGLITDKDKIELVNGLKTVYSADRTFRVSWDRHTLYVLGGVAVHYYFDREDVKERHQLPENPYASNYGDYYYDDYDVEDEAIVEDWYDYEDEIVVSTDSVTLDSVSYEDWLEELDILDTTTNDIGVVTDTVYEDWWDDYSMVDSVLSREEYSDDYYTQYSVYTKQRDSLINILVHAWVDVKLNDMIAGNMVPYSSHKGFEKLSDNTIADIKVRNIGALYRAYYPIDILMAMGLGYSSEFPSFDYGIEEIAAQLVVDRNKLIMKADMSLDQEMTRYYKAIYSKKINRKFLPFLDTQMLGFMSFNIDTEAYIKYFPRIMERYYGPLAGKYSDYLSLGSTLFDILIDEKAVSKVFKGDNLLILNGLVDVDVNYVDYEYDEDYNYTQIERTKTETIPSFLWMFSSDDIRLFTKMLAVAVREGGASDLGGIYALAKSGYRNPFQFFVLLKDGMVFFGNDYAQLENIRDNGISGKGYRPYVNMAKKNNFAMLFNTKKLPELLKELKMPLSRSVELTVEQMSQYGDFYIQSSGIKGNKARGELGIEVPNEKGNALAFLFSIVDHWSMDN